MKKALILLFILTVFGCNNQSAFKNLEFLEYSNIEVSPTKINSGKWGKKRAEVVYENLSYSSSESEDETDLRFDFYKPNGVNRRLPLIVFIHSGAFISGNKKNFIITQYCKDLVRTGDFAAAIIDYRLIDFSSVGSLISKSFTRKKLIESVGDARNAIKHFIDNESRYNIDSNNIFVVGYSAGAIIANQILFTNMSEAKEYISASRIDNAVVAVASMVGYEDAFTVDNKESFDIDLSTNIKGIVSISGAVMSHTMLDDMDNINTPLLLIHGTNDKVVPFGNESPFNRYSEEDFNIYVPNITPASQLSLLRKFTIKKKVIQEVVDFVTTPICGSKCIYDGIFKDSNIKLLEIKNAPHMFMVGEKGLLNETYIETRSSIYNFLKKSYN